MRISTLSFVVCFILTTQLTGCVSSSQVDNLNAQLMFLRIGLTDLQATQTQALVVQQQQANLLAKSQPQLQPTLTVQPGTKINSVSFRQMDVDGHRFSLADEVSTKNGNTILCSQYLDKMEKLAERATFTLGKRCSEVQ